VDNPDKPQREPKTRKPYSKPAIESFELFERRSLTCGTQANTSRITTCGTFVSSVT
jgi:hypothetical protein